ncbi:MAG: phage major capsid protein [Clostridia bacterium]|nr:phage major capsid protein [Clostridia bacterium]
MVTMQTAENALKDIYLGVVSNQLNTKTNALYNQIKQTTTDVYGREVQKLAPFGINGGIGAGDEGGLLPKSAENKYVLLTSTLKNLYGTIEISDKAIRASVDDAGAFVNLLTAEMEGLLESSKFNLGRMLYGDGSGLLCSVTAATEGENIITVDNVNNLIEGMVVDVYNADNILIGFNGVRIIGIDRENKTLTLSVSANSTFATNAKKCKIYVQNSKDQELTGIEKLFATLDPIYGLDRTTYPWINSYDRSKLSTETLDEILLQEFIDEIMERTGSEINFIATTSKVKRILASNLISKRANIDTINLDGGYNAISYNGIPVISDRFIKNGTMYMLNTNDFAMHQLCDWEWLCNEDGSVLKQKEGYASYIATLVKYAELMCSKPAGQARLTNLS